MNGPSNPRSDNDYIDAGRFSVEELRREALEGRGANARAFALALLRAKTYPQKIADLERVLLNDREPARLRQLAAMALGEDGSARAVRVLASASKISDPVALRSVLDGLTRIQTPAARTALRRLRAEPAAPEPLFAGVDVATIEPRMSAPPPTGTIDRKAWRSVRIEAAKAAQRTAVAAGLEALRLGRMRPVRSASRILCEGPELMFVPLTPDAPRFAGLAARPAFAAVVMMGPDVEADTWQPRFEVHTAPDGDGGLRIAVVSADRHRPILIGSGHIEKGRVTFALESARGAPGFQIYLRGRFDGRQLKFDDARVARGRWPATHPAPARPRATTEPTPDRSKEE